MRPYLAAFLLIACSLLSGTAGEDPSQPFPRSKDYNWMSVKAWNERHTKHLEMIKSGGGDLLFVGDSITEGWGGAGKDVWAKEYAPGKTLNLGIGGDTTQNVLWRLANGEVEGLKPKVIVLMPSFPRRIMTRRLFRMRRSFQSR